MASLALISGLSLTALLALSVTLGRGASLGRRAAELSNQRLQAENEERRRVEDRLKVSDERLRLALDSTEIGIFEWNLPSARVFYSAGLWVMLGYDPAKMPATLDTWQALLHPEDVGTFESRLRMLRKGIETTVVSESRVRSGSGDWRWIYTRAKCVTFDSERRPVRLIGTVQDVTARVESEHQLRRAKSEADAASRAKSEFLASMSHEIRTPMNGVIGMTDALLMRHLPDEEREMVQTIRASGAVMLALVDELLDLSKLEAGRLVLRPAPTSLRALCAELRALWLPTASQKHLTLALDLDPALPEALLLDGLRLRQILDNLVSNALKFTEAGGVTVRLTRAGEQLLCAVEDTGIGISLAQQARLFDRFIQADDARARRYQGAGLGLVLSRELARLMDGALEVTSTPGRGSCFTCTLPLVPAERPAAPAAGLRELPPGLQVLVVDDNAVNRLVAQRLLERCGCKVTASVDGEAALGALELHPNFDLVLMDVHMPGLDGLETTRRLRARHGLALRVIGCSASAESADLESCREAGMNDFLAKPVTHERLVEILLRPQGDPHAFAPTARA
jgi:PAS domain S-box-containing protein